ARQLRRAAARAGRARRADVGALRRGRDDDAAGARVALAAHRSPHVSGRTATTLAWGLAGAAVALDLLRHLFVALGLGVGAPGDAEVTAGGAGFVVAFYAFPLVGLVIATRRPGNAIGWLFLALGVVLGLSNAASGYADYALFTDPGRVPAGAWAGWMVEWLDP